MVKVMGVLCHAFSRRIMFIIVLHFLSWFYKKETNIITDGMIWEKFIQSSSID